MDDIIVVTRGMKEEHTRKLYSVLTKLEIEAIKASKKKSNFYQIETMRPNKETTDAKKIRTPNKNQNPKILLVTIHFFANF